MITKVIFSSNSSEWATPQNIYEQLNNEFNFTLDPCSTHENAKCKKHFTKEENGLLKDWSKDVVFVNPPYGRELPLWVEKAYNENKKGAFVVMLIPARTDTKYFHKYIYNKHEIRFIKGRLKFNDERKSAPFPSMIVIMRRKNVANTCYQKIVNSKLCENIEPEPEEFYFAELEEKAERCDKYEQALNEIRNYINNNSNYYSTDTEEIGFVIEETKEETFCTDILQTINKALGGNNE